MLFGVMTEISEADQLDGLRNRIVRAAADLIAAGGSEAATTRAVANAATVQAPAIYRLFGDKRGLLEAVTERALAEFVAAKSARVPDPDPVKNLRRGWDDFIEFGMEHPAIFTLMSVAEPGHVSPTTAAGLLHLRERVTRVAKTGRLRVNEECAVDLIHASGVGTVLTLLGKPVDKRNDLADIAREAVLAAILDETRPPASDAVALATGLRALLPDMSALSPGEHLLLDELLQRIAKSEATTRHRARETPG